LKLEPLESEMESWKKIALAALAAGSAVLVLKGNRTAGLALAGVGLVGLAAEYPEEFATFRENLPGYIEKGSTYLDVVSRMGERVAALTEQRRSNWYEALLQRR
jgi:hypothetical protein